MSESAHVLSLFGGSAELELLPPIRQQKDLELWPLRACWPQSPSSPYVLLEEALREGWAQVDELRTPTVPRLSVSVQKPSLVFIPEGTLLTGGMQTRTVNISLLLNKGEHVIPVSCVERGRWGFRRAFEVEREALTDIVLRRRKITSLRSNWYLRKTPLPDQSLIWHEVFRALEEADRYSDTESYASVLSNAHPLHIPRTLVEEGIVGIIATYRAKVLGMDVFAHSELWRGVHERLLRSYALGLLRAENESGPELGTFCKALTMARWEVLPARVGVGQLQIPGPEREGGLVGFALWHEKRLVHLYAAPL